MYEIRLKSRILKHCERSELCLHFERTNFFLKNAKKCSLWKPEACGQTVLRDRSFLIGQKLAENAKNLLMNTGSPTEPVVIKSVGL